MSAPPKTTYEEVRGFALAMTRMVLDHRGDQVLELARDNIREVTGALSPPDAIPNSPALPPQLQLGADCLS